MPKSRHATDDWYDVWLPNLSPSAELVKAALASTSEKAWHSFVRRFRGEMKRPEASHLLDTLAALSHSASFSIGCYCADETQCHRSVLRDLLEERGAALV